jgi:hypothetical protein
MMLLGMGARGHDLRISDGDQRAIEDIHLDGEPAPGLADAPVVQRVREAS